MVSFLTVLLTIRELFVQFIIHGRFQISILKFFKKRAEKQHANITIWFSTKTFLKSIIPLK